MAFGNLDHGRCRTKRVGQVYDLYRPLVQALH